MYVVFLLFPFVGDSKVELRELFKKNLPLLYLDRCHAKALECYSQSVLKYVSSARSSPPLHSLSIEECSLTILYRFCVKVARLDFSGAHQPNFDCLILYYLGSVGQVTSHNYYRLNELSKSISFIDIGVTIATKQWRHFFPDLNF